MSQFELVMSAALGFAAAALIALLVGRLIWSYSVRLGRRRIERSGPLAMVEMQADRDRLRAEYAMLSTRLEMRLGDLKTRLAEQMADVSRHRNRIDELASTLEAREKTLAQRETEVAQLKDQLAPLENELATRTQALQQLKEQLRDRDTLESELERELAVARARERDDASPKHRSGADASARERVESRIDQLSALARQIETQRQEVAREHAEFKALKDEFAKSQKRRRRKARESAPPPVPVVAADAAPSAQGERIENLDSESRRLVETIEAAEKEAAALQTELKALDDAWIGDLASSEANGGVREGDLSMESVAAHAVVTESPEIAAGDPPNAEEAALPPTRDASATVITLASRIRALQRGVQV